MTPLAGASCPLYFFDSDCCRLPLLGSHLIMGNGGKEFHKEVQIEFLWVNTALCGESLVLRLLLLTPDNSASL
jgi:hypothetical protein